MGVSSSQEIYPMLDSSMSLIYSYQSLGRCFTHSLHCSFIVIKLYDHERVFCFETFKEASCGPDVSVP
eukprot:2148404-Ditylum_brightwellii.AAC.1